MDLLKNRFCGDGYCLFSGNFLCKKNHETETGIKSNSGWYFYDATCPSTNSGRIFSSADLQSAQTVR